MHDEDYDFEESLDNFNYDSVIDMPELPEASAKELGQVVAAPIPPAIADCPSYFDIPNRPSLSMEEIIEEVALYHRFDIPDPFADPDDDVMLDMPELPASSIKEPVLNAAAASLPMTVAARPKATVWVDMNAANTRVQKRIEELMQSDPVLLSVKSKHYGIKVNATPFMKAKEGSSKVYQAIIFDHILTQSGAVKSQTQIRKEVAKIFPSHAVPKDWTKEIPPWAVKKVKQRIQNNIAPISNIKLPKAVTLSQLHEAAAAAVERHAAGAQTFKPVVEVCDTSVVINGVVFSIGNNKVKGVTYQQMRASMPKLLQALASGKSSVGR